MHLLVTIGLTYKTNTVKMTELQEKLEETSVLLKESKDENVGLKEQAVQFSSSSSLGDSSQVEVRCGKVRHIS